MGPVGTAVFYLFEMYVFVCSVGASISDGTSLPRVLLSRFIINLREVDSQNDHPSIGQHPPHFSLPNFRVPSMDDIVGNLGESLDFVKYRVEDEEGGELGAAGQIDVTDLNAERAADVFGPMLAKGEAASSSGSGTVVVVDHRSALSDGLEVRYTYSTILQPGHHHLTFNYDSSFQPNTPPV